MKKIDFTSTGFLLFIALVILWLPWLGETLFYSKGEPREAIVAVSMLQSGNWVLPVTCGADIPYKPPFLAWLIAVFAWLFNGGVVNEFISRLPSTLAAIGLVMAGYSWAKEARGEKFALVMSLVLATSFEFYRAATACRVDMVLTACMVGAMYVIYNIQSRGGGAWRYPLAVVLLTCAVLTKGPVGALLPCFVMGVYYLLRKENFFSALAKMLGLVIVACIVPAVWYYLASLQGGEEFLGLVWEENIGRLTGQMSYESHVRPFHYNFVTIISGLLPWTLLVIMSLLRFRDTIKRPKSAAAIFAATVVVLVIAFYSIPDSKRSTYLLPVYPFLAYWVTCVAEYLSKTRFVEGFTRFLAVLSILVPIILLVNMFVPIAGYQYEAHAWWGYLMLLMPLLMGISWLKIASPKNAMLGAAIICWTLFTCYGGAIMPWALNRQSDKPIAEQFADTDAQIYTIGTPENGGNTYALNYYLGDRMLRVRSVEAIDSLPSGSILVFANPKDTLSLPANYKIEQLTKRLADTRRPAYYTIKP